MEAGIPAGLLEDGSSKVYVLLPNELKAPVLATDIDKMAQKISITGKVYTVGGSQFLTVESFKERYAIHLPGRHPRDQRRERRGAGSRPSA